MLGDRCRAWWVACASAVLKTGPMIGGGLADPAKTMPFLFKSKVWETFPYLLPSIVTALLPATAAVACLVWLPEVRQFVECVASLRDCPAPLDPFSCDRSIARKRDGGDATPASGR